MTARDWQASYRPVTKTSPYLQVNAVAAGKIAFEFTRRLIDAHVSKTHLTLLDVGCASGGFLHHAERWFPQAQLHGVDITDEFISFAQASSLFRESTSFEVADVLEWCPGKTWDVVTCLGTASIFPDVSVLLSKLSEFVNPTGGLLIVQVHLLSIDADVQIRFRHWPETGEDWRSGFNFSSRERAVATLEELGFLVDVVPFEMTIDIDASPKDALRSYTMKILGRDDRLELSPLGVITNSQFLVGVKS